MKKILLTLLFRIEVSDKYCIET